jgi:hypothetical protein
MFELQNNIPVPPPVRRPRQARRRKYPFEDMAIGQHFFVEGKTKNTLGTHVTTVGKQLGRTFSTRLCFMRRDGRGHWQLCEPSDAGAVQGVGVWRVS